MPRVDIGVPFPDFPSPQVGDVVYDDETGQVIMTLDYLGRIYEYKVRVDEARAVWESIKAIESDEGGLYE